MSEPSIGDAGEDCTHFKRESTEERRAAIAAATRALIVEKGMEGLRMRDIAEHVGINIATLHYHVPSKQDLLELVGASLRQTFKDKRASWWREGLTATEELEFELEERSETVLDEPETLIVLGELQARSRHDAGVRAVIQPMFEFWYSQYVNILKRGIANGEFRADLNPEAGAALVIGALTVAQKLPKSDAATLTALNKETLRALKA